MPGYDPQQVALFRYQVIAPLVSLSGPRGTLKREMERIAIRSHDHPQQGPTHYSFATIEEWHYLYKREGFDGLLRSLHPDEVNGYAPPSFSVPTPSRPSAGPPAAFPG